MKHFTALLILSLALLSSFQMLVPVNAYYGAMVDSTDSSLRYNEGIKTTIVAVSQNYKKGSAISFWIAAYAMYPYQNFWVQTGFYVVGGGRGRPIGFLQVWDVSKPNAPIVDVTGPAPAGTHTFAFTLVSGSKWVWTIDGKVYGTFDFGFTSLDAPYVSAEENGPPQPKINDVLFPSAINALVSGKWVAASNAYGGGPLGVAGTKQNPKLKPNQALFSSRLASLPYPTELWKLSP